MLVQRILLGATLGLLCLVCWNCGQPQPRLGMSIQLLDANLRKQIRYLDLGLFDGNKIDCGQITVNNYLSDKDVIKAARLKANANSNDPVLPLDVKDEKPSMASGLPEGNNLIIFVVALALDGENKKKIAFGCINKVNLVKEKTLVVPILLKPT